MTFENTGLWRRTLEAKPKDQFSHEREKLRAALLSFRERAALLAAEIARDLPEYTVHDLTHIDALWQMADLIAGPEYELTPTEAFVLGGAFLVHDLGNGLAAYPDGIEAMHRTATWNDALSLILRRKLGRAPAPDEVRAADEGTKKAATAEVLRTLHAIHAERLALVSWTDPVGGARRYLIEDEFLRDNYGSLIGRIAHSHWWSVDRLKPEFEDAIGAPVTCPPVWIVDPLKLACLLRVSDAAHLDARRAPAFLRAIRHPAGNSLSHWSFQEKLQQPMQNGDRLVYSSAQPFEQSDAASWWLCFDALQVLDKELTASDAVLTDCSRPKFALRGVQGAEDALRLSRWVRTHGWIPVDTQVRVTNVAELAARLGGAQLYGENNLAPLRELIQNAADAIRARRFLEARPEEYGNITVRIGNDSEGHWIEVADNGIGMSELVMTGALLDFGSSFWNSERVMQELPGLASSGFQSTGKYGIGFFSLFMWGNHVRVTSRRYTDAMRDTRVLEFIKGLGSRPILRKAAEQEGLMEGGTAVRIWVGPSSPESGSGVLFRSTRGKKNLESICEWLCPAIDANLQVQRGDSKGKIVVHASDWKTMDGERLLRRLAPEHDLTPWMSRQMDRLIPLTARNLVGLQDRSGDVIGRAAVIPTDLYIDFGAVVDGGLRVCSISKIGGILQGSTVTAARNVAIPTVDPQALAEWASGQQGLLLKYEGDNAADVDLSDLAEAADVIARCGGIIGPLPVAESADGWLSVDDIREWDPMPDEVVLVERQDIEDVTTDLGPLRLGPHVLACGRENAFIIQEGQGLKWPDPVFFDEAPFRNRSTLSLVASLLAENWSASLAEVLAVSTVSRYPDFNWVVVGTIDGKDIERSAHILRNPRGQSIGKTDRTARPPSRNP